MVDSPPIPTEDYDYLSDSDLEDGSSHSGEAPQIITPNNPSLCQSPVKTTENQNGDRSSRFS